MSLNQSTNSYSLNNLIDKINSYFKYLISNQKKIIILTFSFQLVLITFNYVKSPIHYAKTTFVLDSQSSSNPIGDVASLASLAGINASSFIDASGLFQIDNIQELYKSNSMIMKTLMSKSKFDGKDMPLINRFGQVEKIDRKWEKLSVNFYTSSSFEQNKRLNQNTYVVPKECFDSFIKDELCFVKYADKGECRIFRSLHGTTLNISSLKDLQKFKLIMSKKGKRK